MDFMRTSSTQQVELDKRVRLTYLTYILECYATYRYNKVGRENNTCDGGLNPRPTFMGVIEITRLW